MKKTWHWLAFLLISVLVLNTNTQQYAIMAAETSSTEPEYTSIAATWNTSMAVQKDGSVWIWGYKGNAKTGGSSEVATSEAVRLDGLKNVTQLSIGSTTTNNDFFILSLDQNGQLMTCGYNADGQLGDGTTTTRWDPVHIKGFVKPILSIAAGSFHGLAATSDGKAWSWGDNSVGQLGNGTLDQGVRPVPVKGLKRVCAVSAGSGHSLALTTQGQVWSWGDNSYGQLGLGTNKNTLTPTLVPGLPKITSISAGLVHSVAVSTDGEVWTWGWNKFGQLGNGLTKDSSKPAKVPGIANVKTVVAAPSQTFALLKDGTVWVWGANHYRIDVDDPSSLLRPQQIHGLTGIISIAAGMNHFLALSSSGKLWVCGTNDKGQLGIGNTESVSSSVLMLPAEEIAWHTALSLSTIEGYTTYLSKYPNGKYAQQARDQIDDLRWSLVTHDNNVKAYRNFMNIFPDNRHVSDAKSGIEALLQDEAPYLIAVQQGTMVAYNNFLEQFPGHKREADVRNLIQDISDRSIFDLLAEKKIEIKIAGSSISDTTVEIRRLVDHSVSFTIPVGTVFNSSSVSVQNMIVTQAKIVLLANSQPTKVNVATACMNLDRDIPKSTDTFNIQPADANSVLTNLVTVMAKNNARYNTVQAAIWIITYDATWEALGTLVVRPVGQLTGGTRAITEDDAVAAMKYCEQAGIDITTRSIWQDKNTILGNVKDTGLKNWLSTR